MTTEATIRVARPEDDPAIHDVHRTSFPSEEEANLVDRLRADGDALVSVVAVLEDAVIGHALFSRMGIVGAAGEVQAVALAPVAANASCWCWAIPPTTGASVSPPRRRQPSRVRGPARTSWRRR